MDVISRVTLLGGACHRRTLLETHSRAEIDRELASGALIRTGRGRYALGNARDFVLRASKAGGTASHRSAALFHGWALPWVPERADVTFPRNHRVGPGVRRSVVPHWSDLPDHDVEGIVTSKRRTLIDCMRNLPLQESVTIVDEAMRADDFTHREVRAIARSTRGRGRTRIIAVADGAATKAATAFESLLRCHASLVPGLTVVAQPPVRIPGTNLELHPDVGDPRLRLAIEAESFQWHGKTAQLSRDCKRYNAYTLAGWMLVRFSWYQVHYEPEYVREVLLKAVEVARRHANVA